MKLLKMFFYLFFFLISFSCQKIDRWEENRIIESTGEYLISSNKTIIVNKNDGLIFVSLKMENELYDLTSNFSNYSRWFIKLDKDEHIWIYSGDIGPYVWLFNTKKYHEKTIDEEFIKKNKQIIPEEIKIELIKLFNVKKW